MPRKRIIGQSELARKKRLSEGRCPVHGYSLMKVGVDPTDHAVVVSCPRTVCNFKDYAVPRGSEIDKALHSVRTKNEKEVMKIWLLSARTDLPVRNPWQNWFNKMFKCIVQAPTESSARIIAAKAHGGEGEDAWLDTQFSTCIELKTGNDEKIIVRDFTAY